MAQAAFLSTHPDSVKQPRLHAVIGSYGAVQIVPASQKVLLDVQGRAFDVEGSEDRSHGTALIPLDDARQLIAKLQRAVEQAEAANPNQQGLALWSPELRRPNRRRAA